MIRLNAECVFTRCGASQVPAEALCVEERLFEAQAARDQAQQRCTRLQGRLEELFGAALLDERQREALRRGKGAAATRARESELIATVESLQRALERKQREAEHLVPSSRLMQVRTLADERSVA